jgi:beta-lactam-binding protein with PASTA domain
VVTGIAALAIAGCGSSGVKVPDVEGQSEDSATAELKANGFDVKSQVSGPNCHIFECRVVGQAPTAGEEADEGGTVTIILGD